MNHKRIILLILLLLIASAFASPTWASIPAPSPPTFTLKVLDTSYDVPTTYTIDAFTGANITHQGYHVTQHSIQVSIKNQQYPTTVDNNNISLYYKIHTKGHYIDKWTELPTQQVDPSGYISAQPEEYTVVSFPGDYPQGVADFQVQAILGYHEFVHPYSSNFVMMESPWSPTQSLTFDGSSPKISETPPTFTPSLISASPQEEPTKLMSIGTNSGFQESALIITAIVIVALIVLLIVQRRKINSAVKF